MFLVTLLAIVLLLLCVFLVFLILSQDVRGGGLAGALGGGNVQGAFGGRSAESIVKMTAYLIVVFFVVVLVMRWFSVGGTGAAGVMPSQGNQAPTSSQAPAAPGQTPGQ